MRRLHHPAHSTHRSSLRFVGFVLVLVGGAFTAVGLLSFFGAMTRYVLSETAPVAADATNYVVENTKDSLRVAAQAIGEGLRGDRAVLASEACPSCRAPQPSDANFCAACGAAMPRDRACGNCRQVNPPTARFCNGCGAGLAST